MPTARRPFPRGGGGGPSSCPRGTLGPPGRRHLTGDDRLRAEGQTESAAAGAKDAVENAGDKVRDTAAAIKDGLSTDR